VAIFNIRLLFLHFSELEFYQARLTPETDEGGSMKIATASKLAIISTAAAAALAAGWTVPAAYGQRVQAPPIKLPNVPTNPVLPPLIQPMRNPVAPIIQSPFIRHNGTTPEVVNPSQNRRDDRRDDNDGRGQRGGRNVVFVPVPAPYYYDNYNYYYTPPEPTVSVPGQLPQRRSDYERERQTSFNPNPNLPAAPAGTPASTFVYEPQPVAYSEPRMIINEPRPNLVIQPPALGTSRAEVYQRYGNPFGTITARGTETLYFDGGLIVVIGADGRVIQTR
jgi:hypothetical protein